MSWQSTVSVEGITQRLAAAGTVTCITHAKPDGDAIGCVLGLVRGLNAGAGETRSEGLLVRPVPQPLLRLVGDTPVTLMGPDDAPPVEAPDCIVVVDTGAWTQVGPLADWLRAHHDRVVVIDHHASGDADMSDTRLIDASAASATMVVLRVLKAMGVDPAADGGAIAEALFAGLATDTGWFRQANADAAAFACAAELLACGVDKNKLYRTIEETARTERFVERFRYKASKARQVDEDSTHAGMLLQERWIDSAA